MASRQALPAPPGTACSSTVTNASWVRASSSIIPASIGLTQRMFATVASSASAAARAGWTIEPNARKAMRRPLRRSSALPNGSSVRSLSTSTPTPEPRG